MHLSRDLQESQRVSCQYWSSSIGTSLSSASHADAARHHVVHQARQIARQRQRRVAGPPTT